MSETSKSIKVVDRRMFTPDGEVREEVRAELEASEAAEARSAGARKNATAAAPSEPAAPPEPVTPTDPAFLRLLDMLAQTAGMYLQGFPDPATGRRSVDLTAARDIIDSLTALREKTRGRLSFEESDAVDGILGDLQMAFTRLASSVKAPPVPPPPGAKRRG